MTTRRRRPAKKPIESYDHRGKERLNNPPVGLVTPDTDRDAGRKTYAYDPHLDPQLQWAGKAEHTSFEVPTVSLHVHERIDPRTIIEATCKRNGNGEAAQPRLWELPEENPPVRDAIDFYRHRHNWTNRLVSGDSLLVMNSLLEKEGMAGKVQMVYIDPPYGIRYGSNFQPFVNKRDVKDGKDDDLTREPETIRAFQDTWELGIHSYLSYLRDRLLLARELLAESGSIFVQISDENQHKVRALLEEVFGEENFVSQINYRSMSPLGQNRLANIYDYILWYAKNKEQMKFRPLFVERNIEDEPEFCYLDTGNGDFEKLPRVELLNLSSKKRERIFKRSVLTSSGYTPSCTYDFSFNGNTYKPLSGKSWRTHADGMKTLVNVHRVFTLGNNPYFRQYHSDFPLIQLENGWRDTAAGFGEPKVFVVQTNVKIVARCMLMATEPGDLVFDPTCGSGTTAYVAEQWGRRWITCDTSRVAVTLARQRIMTAAYDYYELAYPDEGVGSGFKYKTAPHITLGSIANNPDIKEGMTQAEIDEAIAQHSPQETLYDQPLVDTGKKRVTGPFSVEAVPAPAVKPLDDTGDQDGAAADDSVARSGESKRQADWRDQLLRAGIRGKAGQYIRFASLDPLPGSPRLRNLHAIGETRTNDRGADSVGGVKDRGPAKEEQRVVVSFGPEHAPMEQRQVEWALQEAQTLRPTPRIIVFAAFQFDPEAAKDIDETNWPNMQLLKAQMDPDLLTEGLKKKKSNNESFWLIGQPDVGLHQIRRGQNTGKWQAYVSGFDYYNTKTGEVESGGEDQIAVWMLDTDYDGRSLYPRQVFFPMAGPRDGWERLARNLKAEIDESLIEAYRGTVSLPFEPGEHQRIAVKIVDDRGIESLKVMGLDSLPGGATSPEKKGRTLEEILTEASKNVPQEEWDRLPDDLIDNLDHYTAGADKR